MRIDLEHISERQLLTITNGVNYYLYIQKHYNDVDERDAEDFRDVFTEFYLKAQGKMRDPVNRVPFFETMKTCSPDKDLIELLIELHNKLDTDLYEFSFATKLLHTINNDSPIFDSKVFKYLKEEEGVNFWEYRHSKDGLERARHNWPLLKNWYDSFLQTERAAEWIAWFDRQFPNAAHIAAVKKIDFLIFAFN